MRTFQTLIWRKIAAATLIAMAATTASAGVVSIDISPTSSVDGLGDTDNSVVLIDLNALLGTVGAVHVDGLGWDVLVETVSPSWLSEARIALQDSAGNLLVDFVPGVVDTFAGAATYDSAGIVDFVSLGLDFMLADGILRLEFYETFDDFPNDIDALWSGTLSLSATGNPIPLPAAAWLLLSGVASLFGVRRRRA